VVDWGIGVFISASCTVGPIVISEMPTSCTVVPPGDRTVLLVSH